MTATEVITFDGVEQLAALEQSIAEAPSHVYFWIRDAMMRIAIEHRTTFLRRVPIKLSKSLAGRAAISTPKVGEPVPDAELDRAIRWQVYPEAKRKPDATEEDLDGLYFEALSRAVVLVGYEQGIAIAPKARQKLAIPLIAPGGKARGRLSPAEFRARNPKAVLIARRSKSSGNLTLYERKRKRSKSPRGRAERTTTGKVRKTQRGAWVDTLVPRWSLVDRVDLRRSLGFYAAWAATRGSRATSLQRALRSIVRDVSAGLRK